MKKMYISLSCIFIIGCAGSASDYSTSNGRAPILNDAYLDASGNVIDEEADEDFGPPSAEPTDPQGNEEEESNTDESEDNTSDPNETTVGTGQCMNENDLEVLNNDDPSFDSLLNTCSNGCFEVPPPENCLSNCLTQASSISDGCAQCYDGLMTCYMTSCLDDCFEEGSDTACEACLGENCYPDFISCSGFDPDNF